LPDLEYVYEAQRFRPRPGAQQELLLFVAPASEIRTWAGIPRKTFDYQHGFQRTLNPGRVGEVSQFFAHDARNVSPTSVVVGLSEVVQVEADAHVQEGEGAAGAERVRVRITLPDYTALEMPALAELALVELRSRLPEVVVAEVDANVDLAFAEAVRLAEEDAIDGSVGEAHAEAVEGTEDGEEDGRTELDTGGEERSYLSDFYAQLLGFSRGVQPWPEGDQLREVLYSLLRPAIIVDGQHRVFGGAHADGDMLFAVCAMVNSSWAESVYQFVVINQKAKPIKPAFLSTIVATSLNDEEMASVYDRLRTSRVNVALAETMNLVNTADASPFRGMIDFEVEASPGFLQFPGMSRLVRDFQALPRTHAVLLPGGDWEGVQGEWIDHFFAFWRGVKSYFEGQDARLWRRPSIDISNNLLKIVTLQEVQRLMLDLWAGSRLLRFGEIERTEELAGTFWEEFPSSFFTDEWRLKGLQTSVGRRMLREYMLDTRMNIGRRNWGHRRLKLFSD
jgi:hypothetical protein